MLQYYTAISCCHAALPCHDDFESTCTRFLELHVACWQGPFAFAWLNGSLAQQNFTFMLHNTPNYLQDQDRVHAQLVRDV